MKTVSSSGEEVSRKILFQLPTATAPSANYSLSLPKMGICEAISSQRFWIST